MAADFNKELGEYSERLNALKKVCDDAEKAIIVSETKLSQLQAQRQQLSEECMSYANTADPNELQNIVNEKITELRSIMTSLQNIDVTKVTAETATALGRISNSINPVL